MTTAPEAVSTTPEQQQEHRLLCLAIVPRNGFGPLATLVPYQFPLYWIEVAPHLIPPDTAPQDTELGAALVEILADPLLEAACFDNASTRRTMTKLWQDAGFYWFAERQFLPGVTDNLARTVEEALSLKGFSNGVKVASGTGFLTGETSGDQCDLEETGRYSLYHPLTDRFKVHNLGALYNRYLRFPAVHLPESKPPEVVSLELTDAQLMSLSRDRLLALSLEEMQAIRNWYRTDSTKAIRKKEGLPEDPLDLELEVIAQTWSEHCKHKIFSANITHKETWSEGNKGGGRGLRVESLYKTYIQGPTYELMKKRDDLLSVFEDNSGVIRWDEHTGVCFKVETHNSPSALEPYGGALTGILGVNRDILGTGLGARPIFNTDVFCFAFPSALLPIRPKLLPPETIIRGVRKGVQDGGNKSGIPVVNGAVCFHSGYRAKPLVFCGTGGVLPLTVHGKSGVDKHTVTDDIIVMAGGRVGKDGIHGATFSSEALHEGSPVTAVQIGDPFTQKRLTDFVLEARDQGLISGITDNGAGGLSSSVGEMARITGGAILELAEIPLKYAGLSDYEIVISESQERMTLSTAKWSELKALAAKFNVEVTDVGRFTTDGNFRITRQGRTIALLDLEFLHKGVPKMELQSEWTPTVVVERVPTEVPDYKNMLLQVLSHPNVSSREFVIRQYDHEVQGASVVKPLMGPLQKAPCDAGVSRVDLNDKAGLVVSCGICPQLSVYDTYLMAQCAADEAVRNAVCVGADPASIVLLDNFCWPDPIESEKNKEGKYKLGQLVRACEGLAEAVRAYQTPLISGKDSMKNDFDDGVVRLSIPPTLLVSGMGRVPDSDKAVTMHFKNTDDAVYLLIAGSTGIAGSVYADIVGWQSGITPTLDLSMSPLLYQQLHQSMLADLVRSAHDLSEGGLGVALSECALGSGLGAHIWTHRIASAAAACIPQDDPLDRALLTRLDYALFAEGPARILVTVAADKKKEFEKQMENVICIEIGKVTSDPNLVFSNADAEVVFSVPCSDLLKAWEAILPFQDEFGSDIEEAIAEDQQ